MNKKKVATKEQEGYAGCVWCLGNLIDGTPCWRLLKKPYPHRIPDCCYYDKARKVLPKLIAISIEEIVEIRRALQVIKFNIQRELSYRKMTKNIIEQVKRIDKLLPKEVVDKIEERR